MFWDIVSVLMLLSIVAQVYYLLRIGGAGAVRSNAPHPLKGTHQMPLLPVSVIICARNEAANLRERLPSILEQEYGVAGVPNYEVIVVDDCSEDGTAHVLQSFVKNYTHLRIVSVAPEDPRTLPGKKFALSKGIAAARYAHVLMTDADCTAASVHWLELMTKAFVGGLEIVAGYGAYRPEGGWLNRFIRCETVFTFLQMNGMAKLGMPYMAVGRNLAVKKSLLQRAQANDLWKKTPSGDDDLLVRLCATGDNYVVLHQPDAFTFSGAKPSWADYLRQKQRHMSTGKLYKPIVKAWLGTAGISHALFWSLLPLWIAGVVAGALPAISNSTLIVLIFLRFITFYLRMGQWCRRLGEQGLAPFIPVFDCLLAGYSIILSPYILWKTRQGWK